VSIRHTSAPVVNAAEITSAQPSSATALSPRRRAPHMTGMKRARSIIGGAGIAALVLCAAAGTAVAQTQAQRLAAWSQAILLHRLDRSAAENAREVERLEAQIEQMDQAPRAERDRSCRFVAGEEGAPAGAPDAALSCSAARPAR
jgi:uncharacterized protein HemX